MARLDAIWNQARADLTIVTEQGERDPFLLEHSERVARAAQLIAKLSLVREHAPDEYALVAAALYHDAGWIARFRGGEVRPCDILTRTANESHSQLGARLMEVSLAKLLPPDVLERASLAIRSLTDRSIQCIEGQVVAEAENLDEFGLQVLWPIIRRGALDGKGIKAAIGTWQRRREYQFWTARLADSFRFAPVRELAERRLAAFDQMMAELQRHHDGEDLRQAVGESSSTQTVDSTAG